MKIEIGSKDPIKPTVEAIESMQRNIDYWGRRCEMAESALRRADYYIDRLEAAQNGIPVRDLDEASCAWEAARIKVENVLAR